MYRPAKVSFIKSYFSYIYYFSSKSNCPSPQCTIFFVSYLLTLSLSLSLPLPLFLSRGIFLRSFFCQCAHANAGVNNASMKNNKNLAHIRPVHMLRIRTYSRPTRNTRLTTTTIIYYIINIVDCAESLPLSGRDRHTRTVLRGRGRISI